MASRENEPEPAGQGWDTLGGPTGRKGRTNWAARTSPPICWVAPTWRNGRTNWAVQTGQTPLALWADPTRWSGRTYCAARLSARPPPVEAARHSPKIQALITTRDLLGTAADELAVGPFRTVGGRFIPNERGGLP